MTGPEVVPASFADGVAALFGGGLEVLSVNGRLLAVSARARVEVADLPVDWREWLEGVFDRAGGAPVGVSLGPIAPHPPSGAL